MKRWQSPAVKMDWRSDKWPSESMLPWKRFACISARVCSFPWKHQPVNASSPRRICIGFFASGAWSRKKNWTSKAFAGCWRSCRVGIWSPARCKTKADVRLTPASRNLAGPWSRIFPKFAATRIAASVRFIRVLQIARISKLCCISWSIMNKSLFGR